MTPFWVQDVFWLHETLPMSGIWATSAPTPSDPPGHTMGESGAERGGTNAANDATNKPPARQRNATMNLGARMFAKKGFLIGTSSTDIPHRFGRIV